MGSVERLVGVQEAIIINETTGEITIKIVAIKKASLKHHACTAQPLTHIYQCSLASIHVNMAKLMTGRADGFSLLYLY